MSTTPTSLPHHYRQRSESRTRHSNSVNRPTTPLRAASRTSLRASTTTPTNHGPQGPQDHPLNVLEPAFAEFSDSMADLEANMFHLQILQESLTRFNENFGAFLYGLNMNAFTVDFTEAPGNESFRRATEAAERGEGMDGGRFGYGGAIGHGQGGNGLTGGGLPKDVDATFLTTDTSFVENPPTPRTTRTTGKFATPAPPSAASTRTANTSRGGSAMGRGSGAAGRGGTAPTAGGTARTKGAPVVRGTRAQQLAAARRETLAARGRGGLR